MLDASTAGSNPRAAVRGLAPAMREGRVVRPDVGRRRRGGGPDRHLVLFFGEPLMVEMNERGADEGARHGLA